MSSIRSRHQQLTLPRGIRIVWGVLTLTTTLVFLALVGGRFVIPSAGIIAFTSNPNGNWDIYALDVGNGALINLTDSPSDDLGPAWSPATKQLAFYSDRDGDGAAEIYLMKIGWKSTKRVITGQGNFWRPQWSPDGQQIVFINDYGNVLILDSDGKNRRGLTYGFGPTWSPTDAEIAYYANRPGDPEADIYTIDPGGHHLRNLTQNHGDDWNPAWSPDGHFLAFVSSRDGNPEIYLMAAGCAAPCPVQRLTYNVTMDLAPTWSLDGQSIAFESQVGNAWQVFVMNRDGTNPHRLNLALADSRSPAFLSLDGE